MHYHNLGGTYDELGRQYAEQLAANGRSLADASPETLQPSADRLELARACADCLAEHAPYLLEELRGIADATSIDAERVRAVPLALDAEAGCSLVAISGEHTGTGRPLLARNHDFYPAFRAFATRYRTDPADGLASVGCSAVYVGRCDGVNEAGLAIGFAEVPPHEFEAGLTWQLAIRAVLDTCRNVSEAIDFLETVPHATNVNFLLADAAGDIALVEASPERVVATRPDGGFVPVTREFHTPSMREAYQSTDRTPADCERRQALRTWFDDRDEDVSVGSLQRAMGDPENGVCWPMETGNPRSTIWSWAIDPVERAGYLADGSPVDTEYERVSVPGHR